MAMNNKPNPVRVYLDGSCLNDGTARAREGSGAYWGPGCKSNFALRVLNARTNNRGEVYAIIRVSEIESHRETLHISSDSEYAMKTLVTRGPENESRGWSNITNGDLFHDIVSLIKQRSAAVKFIQVKGHSGLAYHNEADRHAKEGAGKPPVGNYVRLALRQVPPATNMTTTTQHTQIKVL
jgi:ribonuclease HI